MVFLLACSNPAVDDSKVPPIDSGDSETETTIPDTVPCDADPDLSVLTFTTAELAHPNEVRLDVTLSVAATLAVACTLDDDPTEVHLVESTVAGTTHELRLAGLLGDSTYTCAAAAVCPSMSTPLATTTITTGQVSDALPVMEVESSYDATEYILLQHSLDCQWETGRFVVVDRDGRVRWWYDYPDNVGPSLEFRYHGDNQFVWGGGWEPNELGRPRVLDLYDGEVYDTSIAIPDFDRSGFHHDGKQLADGRLLTLEEVNIDNGDDDFQGWQVRAIDPATNSVGFTYHSQRAFDEGHLDAGDGDTWHANWVDIVEGTLYVSMCFDETIAAIDAETGDWLWSLGEGGDWSLQDADGSALSDTQYPQCQHGLEKVGDRLLVYDNGRNRGFSRALEYELDESTMTATQLWEWTEADWDEGTLGDVDYLPGGRILITAGHAECFSSNPGDRTSLYDIDPSTGEKGWELQYSDVDAMAYRADWADACSLFANTKYCPRLAARWEQLAWAFGRD